MTLNQVLDEIKRLNSSNHTGWQYVAHLLSKTGGRPMHILAIPLQDDEYSVESTVGVYTTRQVLTQDKLLHWRCAEDPNWQIWKWLPNEERRIFQPAEETMISDSRTN